MEITDSNVQRVLRTLGKAQGWMTEDEIVATYNKTYPPPRIPGTSLALPGIRATKVRSLLKFLGELGMTQREVTNFTHGHHTSPVAQYRLSQTGIQYHAKLKAH